MRIRSKAVLWVFCILLIGPGLTQAEDDVNLLMRQLRGEDPATDINSQISAALQLANIGQLAVEPLIGVLKDKSPMVRSHAAIALGAIRDSRAAAPLAAALADEDGLVASHAAKALEKMGKPAVEPLIAALKNKNARARRLAARVLGEIKDGRATMPLTVLLQDQERTVRRDAAEALGKIGDVRAVEASIATLRTTTGVSGVVRHGLWPRWAHLRSSPSLLP